MRSSAPRILAGGLVLVLVFASGAFVHRSGFFVELKMLFDSGVLGAPLRVLNGLSTDVELLSIKIKEKHFQKLEAQRDRALERGVLITSKKDFVPAVLTRNGVSVKASIRLKGDHVDHLRKNKWSFRIRIKNKKTLGGMNHFSLQNPRTKSYLLEWLFHRALKREGVPALRYEFLAVKINEKNVGIYALEENFEKRLIEDNRRREGPVVRFNEDIRWKEYQRRQKNFPSTPLMDGGSYMSAASDTFESDVLLEKGALAGQHRKAMALLEAFRRGRLPADKVFDIAVMSRYFALTDLFGGEHGARWHNARFYYNPVTSLLEPIGFDAFEDKVPTSLTRLVGAVGRAGLGPADMVASGSYYTRIFQNPVLFSAYVSELERVSNKKYLDDLLASVKADMENALGILHKSFPHYNFSPRVLRSNQAYIRAHLNPVRTLHAFSEGGLGTRIQLSVGNIQPLPIELIKVTWKGGEALAEEPPLIAGKKPKWPVDYKKVGFGLGPKKSKPLKIHFRLLGSSKVRTQKIYAWPFPDPHQVLRDLARQEPNPKQFPFIRVDDETREVLVARGSWVIDKDLIFPAGYRVVAFEGTELNLTKKAMILSYSPLEFRGTEDEPIVLSSSDGTGQGLLVMRTNEASVMSHVIVKNMAFAKREDWSLSGTVTFYEAEVHILNCQFIENKSEDALNLIRSKFLIRKSLFDGAASDSLDSDFCVGEIIQSTFLNSGNDAVDFSNSNVVIRDMTIIGAGDKGISAGEMSQVEARKVSIAQAGTAVASKDWSRVELRNLQIDSCETALAVYQKKPEYGPGSMEVWGIKIQGAGGGHFVEKGSSLKIEGRVIEPTPAE